MSGSQSSAILVSMPSLSDSLVPARKTSMERTQLFHVLLRLRPRSIAPSGVRLSVAPLFLLGTKRVHQVHHGTTRYDKGFRPSRRVSR